MDLRGRVVAAALALLATVTGGVKRADKFATLTAPVIALTHARVFDGSGLLWAPIIGLIFRHYRDRFVGPDDTATADVS